MSTSCKFRWAAVVTAVVLGACGMDGSIPQGGERSARAESALTEVNGVVLDWIDQFDSTGYGNEAAREVVRDASGNVYVAGYTNGQLAEGFAGSKDVFVAKIGPDGDLLWVVQRGTPFDDRGLGMVATPDWDGDGQADAIHIVGFSSGDFCGPSRGSSDAFLLTLDASGNEVECIAFGSSGADSARDVTLDELGNVLVVGDSGGPLESTNLPPDGICRSGAGAGDAILVRFHRGADGLLTEDLACEIGSTGFDRALGVAVDSDGRIALVGNAGTALTYGTPDQGICEAADDKANDAFAVVLEVTENGDGPSIQELYACQFGSAVTDSASAVVFVESEDVFYVAGQFSQALGTGLDTDLCRSNGFGQFDGYVLKFGAEGPGDLCHVGSDQNDDVAALATDGTTVYLAGTTGGSSAGPSSGGDDIFVVRDPFSQTPSATQVGSVEGRDDTAFGLAVTATGLTVAGDTGGTLPGAEWHGGTDAAVLTYEFDETEGAFNLISSTQVGGPGPGIEVATKVAVDGGVWVTGWVRGELSGESAAGSADAFVRHLDTEGHPFDQCEVGAAACPTDQFGTTQDDYALNIATDGRSGAVYVVGYSEGDWDPDPDINFPGWTRLGPSDGFIRKYGAGGAVEWQDVFGTSAVDRALGVYAQGSFVYAVGVTFGQLGQTMAGRPNGFLRVYDTAGNHLQTYQLASEDGLPTLAREVVAGPSGVYVLGYTLGSSIDGPSFGGTDAIVWKFPTLAPQASPRAPGPPLRPVWAERIGGPGNDFAFGLGIAGGMIYLAGETNASVAGQPSCGSFDTFVAGVSTDGQTQWVRVLGSQGVEYPNALVATPDGPLVAGTTTGALAGHTSNGGYDGFLASYDRDGAFRWSLHLGTASDDELNGVAYKAGDAYAAGYTEGFLAAPAGDADGFVVRLPTAGLTGGLPGCGGL